MGRPPPFFLCEEYPVEIINPNAIPRLEDGVRILMRWIMRAQMGIRCPVWAYARNQMLSLCSTVSLRSVNGF